MKRLTSSLEQRSFYTKHRFIELEHLIAPISAEELKEKIDTLLALELKRPIKDASPQDLFLAGRDLWRKDSSLKKAFLNPLLAELASHFFCATPLRLAYTQNLRTPYVATSPLPNGTLAEISSCEPIIGGLLIRLSQGKKIIPSVMEEAQAYPRIKSNQELGLSPQLSAKLAPDLPEYLPFPEKIGSGVFFDLQKQVDFQTLFQEVEESFLLIVYCPSKARYVLREKDPATHFLKKEGYGFGDLLHPTRHPVVYR